MAIDALKPSKLLNPEFGAKVHRTNRDLLDVTAKLAEEKVPAFTKILYVWGIDVPRVLGLIPDAYRDDASKVRHYLNIGKLLEAPGKWIRNCNTLRDRSVRLLDEGASWGGVYQWIRGLNGMINPTFDHLDFLVKADIVQIAKPTFALCKGINGIGMVGGFGASALDSIIKFNNNEALVNETGEKYEIAKEEAIVNLLQLAYEVSLLALGVLTVLSIFFAVVVAEAAFITFSASSVAANTANYFYQHIGPGLKKNELKGKV